MIIYTLHSAKSFESASNFLLDEEEHQAKRSLGVP